MPRDGDVADDFRRAEQRLRRMLFGDGVTEPGLVKGEEARMQVTATLRRLRRAFTQALAADSGDVAPENGSSPLSEELQGRAARAVRRRRGFAEDRLLTPFEAAEVLGISPSSVYRAIREGRIEAVRIRGGPLRIPASELWHIRATAR